MDYKQIIKEEYKKCASNPIYFMKKYCYIQHRTRGRINFSLFKFQERVLQEFIDHDYNIILKSRQLGISTLTGGYALWMMTFHSDKNIIILATTQDVAKNLVDIVRFMYDNLPSWLRVDAVELNKLNIKLKNGSQIKAKSSAVTSGRGDAASLAVIDEAAFIDRMDEIWGSIQQTLATGGKSIVLSTPNAVGNWYHKTWVDAKAGKNRFNTIQLHWSMHPERDQSWRDMQTELLGKRLAAQECFDGDTRIYSEFGLIPIKDIRIGDKVLTHTGRFMPVINIIENYSSNVSEIYSNLNKKKSYVTENHPFYDESNNWIPLKDVKNEQMLISIPRNIEFNKADNTIDLYSSIELENLNKELFDGINKFSVSNCETIYNRFIDIDYDFGFIIGLYCVKSDIKGTTIKFQYKCKDFEFWPKALISIIKSKFGDIKCDIIENKEFNYIKIDSEILCEFFKLFIKDSGGLSKFSYRLSNIDFLKGYMDAIFNCKGILLNRYNKSIYLDNENIMYDIKYISSIIGIKLNLLDVDVENKFLIKNKILKYMLTYIRTIGLECDDRKVSSLCKKSLNELDVYNKAFLIDDVLYSKIYKRKYDWTIDTFNLEVEGDNSFVTEHFVVHNCDANFNSSGKTVVDLDTLDWYKDTQCQPPKEKRNSGLYWIWDGPVDGKQYIVCADVARGDGEENSAFHVLDLETLQQVAEYDGLMDTNEYGNLLVSVSTEYNDAILVIENTGIGWAVIQKVIDRGYKNLFYMQNDLKYVDPEHQHSNKLYSRDKKSVAGFTTSIRTRPLIVSKIESYFEKRDVTIRSERLIEQLRTFIWKGNKAEHADGYTDDLVTSLAIGLWVRDTAIQLNLHNIEINKKLLGMITVTRPDQSQNIGPLPGIIVNPADSWIMQTTHGDIEDLTEYLPPESRKKPQ